VERLEVDGARPGRHEMLKALGTFLGAVAVAAFVWFSYHPLASPHVYLYALGAAGLIIAAASLAGGRTSAGGADLLDMQAAPLPPPASIDPVREPPSVPATPESLPAWAQLQWDLTRALWAVRAGEAELAGQELAELVVTSLEEAISEPHTRERLTDAALLAEGYRAIAEGRTPDYHPERFRGLLQRVDVEIRLAELDVDDRRVMRDARRIQSDVEGFTPEERLQRARDRWERLSHTEARWVEVYLLKRGYEALLQDHDSREEHAF
jgi:hypothetical protein